MFCPKCKVGMKPLFSSWYCPNDCDRPQAKTPSYEGVIKVTVSSKGNVVTVNAGVTSPATTLRHSTPFQITDVMLENMHGVGGNCPFGCPFKVHTFDKKWKQGYCGTPAGSEHIWNWV